jgi:ferritin
MKDLLKDPSDYFKRQPRVDLDKYNYNHEQFRRYTREYNKAKEADDKNSKQLYKLVRYVKENKDNKSDSFVKKFTEIDQFDPDLIEVPEEFKDLDLEDLEHVNAKKI